MKKAQNVLLLLFCTLSSTANATDFDSDKPLFRAADRSFLHTDPTDILVVESQYMVAGSELIIYHSTGKEFIRKTVTKKKEEFDTSSWPAGTYYIVLSSNNMNTIISSYKVERRKE